MTVSLAAQEWAFSDQEIHFQNRVKKTLSEVVNLIAVYNRV